MNATTLWLLISLNSGYLSAPSGHYVVIERFWTAKDCAQVQAALPASTTANTKCIQATIAAPK